MTVIEFAPDSAQAGVYRSLARSILENRDLVIPTPLSMDDLESLAMEFLPA
jgi:nitrogenase iron protein NifH